MCYQNLRLGRCISILVIVVLVIIAISVSASTISKKTFDEAYSMQAIVVQDGDTLWNLAEKYYAHNNYEIQKIIWEIQKANSLSSGEIYIGQILYLPTL